MFDELYDSGAGERKNVLETLSEGAMTVSEIAKKLGRSRNGHLTEVLKDLSQGGFVAAERGINPETGELRQEIRYRICDNYVRFYLRTILPRRDMIENGAYRFESLEQLPGWNSILGLQFENMVLGALPALVHKLHLEKTRIVSMSPFRLSRSRVVSASCCGASTFLVPHPARRMQSNEMIEMCLIG